jgi:hypothetical protein
MCRAIIFLLLFGGLVSAEAAAREETDKRLAQDASPAIRLVLAPETVAIRGLAQGRVTVAAPAPAGGVPIRLRSLDPSLAVVPEQLVIAEGQTAATFPIEAGDLTGAESKSVTITATWEKSSSDARLLVVRNRVVVSVSPQFLIAGASATGTVTLWYPARKGGMRIPLSTSYTGSFDMPALVVVAEGERSSTFVLTHQEAYAKREITINAFNEDTGETVGYVVTVELNDVEDLGFEPAGRMVSGSVVTCTARLKAPAVRDMELYIGVKATSDASCIGLPERVTIKAGERQVAFPIQYNEVLQTKDVTISIASVLGGATRFATLTVDPTTITGLALEKAELQSDERTKGTVTLQVPAPPRGIHVLVSSNPESAVGILPYGLDILGGQSSGAFEVVAKSVAAETPVTISAVYRGITFQKARLTVKPASRPETTKVFAPKTPRTPAVSIVSLQKLEVAVVRSSTRSASGLRIRVFLSRPAPQGGVDVQLSSTHPQLVALPSTVTVNPGQTLAELTVKTSQAKGRTLVTIVASYGGVSKTQTVTIQP